MIERIAKAGLLGVTANSGGQAFERVLARALNAQLARAIFRAAQKEHPQSRILLRRGARMVADSAD